MDAPTCECGRLDNPAVIGMGHHEEVFRTLDRLRHRGSPWWWFLAFRCRACGQDWLVASEERQNDVYILRRLDSATAERIARENVWPSDFDRYETLLEIGRAAGHAVRFFDVADSPLLHTITDLAKERPGIRVSELASLLNLDPAVATELARQVVSGIACACFVCRSARAAAEPAHRVAPGSVRITFDAE
jgi:hypothetical protein